MLIQLPKWMLRSLIAVTLSCASFLALAQLLGALAAAILWICGDIWAVPVFVILVRRVISRDGSLFASLDRYASPSS